MLDEARSSLAAILLTPFNLIPDRILSAEVPFVYVNVLGITEDEAQLARALSADSLLACMRHKGLDQVTRDSRNSIFSKTEMELEKKHVELPFDNKRLWEKMLWR